MYEQLQKLRNAAPGTEDKVMLEIMNYYSAEQERVIKEFEEEHQRHLEREANICAKIESLLSNNWIVREIGVDVSAPISF